MLCLGLLRRHIRTAQVLLALVGDTPLFSCSTMAAVAEPATKKAKTEYAHTREVRRSNAMKAVTTGRFRVLLYVLVELAGRLIDTPSVINRVMLLTVPLSLQWGAAV